MECPDCTTALEGDIEFDNETTDYYKICPNAECGSEWIVRDTTGVLGGLSVWSIVGRREKNR